jgi:hypothetical protein
LRFFIENKASATAKEIIAACSKNVDEASTRIQTEFRLKTDVVSTEIGNDQKSRKADLDVAFGGLKDGIAQLQANEPDRSAHPHDAKVGLGPRRFLPIGSTRSHVQGRPVTM